MSITTAKAANVSPMPENIKEPAARPTASAVLFRAGRAWSASSMPRPQATAPTKAIWNAHSRFSHPAPSTRNIAAQARAMTSPARRRTSSNSRTALVACSASRTNMYGT